MKNDKKIQQVLRDGKYLVDNRTETERYLLVEYKNEYFEIELLNGEIQRFSISEFLPKYAKILIESKYNQVRK